MAEYIIKETLQEKLNRKKAGPANKRYTEGWNDAILMVKSIIHSEKAADVATVRHGMWETIDASTWRWSHDGAKPVHRVKYRHNECGRVVQRKEPYCPNCGAKMLDLEG